MMQHKRILLNLVVVAIASMTTTTTAMVLREPASRKVIVKAVDSSKSVASSKAKKGEWSPSSWRAKEAKQIPIYPDQEALEEVERELSKSAPLVFAGEVRTLSEQLALASQGKTFVLFGGDCAESFDEFSVNHIQDTFRVILQMSLILTHGGSKPVVKIGRMAGKIKYQLPTNLESLYLLYPKENCHLIIIHYTYLLACSFICSLVHILMLSFTDICLCRSMT